MISSDISVIQMHEPTPDLLVKANEKFYDKIQEKLNAA